MHQVVAAEGAGVLPPADERHDDLRPQADGFTLPAASGAGGSRSPCSSPVRRARGDEGRAPRPRSSRSARTRGSTVRQLLGDQIRGAARGALSVGERCRRPCGQHRRRQRADEQAATIRRGSGPSCGTPSWASARPTERPEPGRGRGAGRGSGPVADVPEPRGTVQPVRRAGRPGSSHAPRGGRRGPTVAGQRRNPTGFASAARVFRTLADPCVRPATRAWVQALPVFGPKSTFDLGNRGIAGRSLGYRFVQNAEHASPARNGGRSPRKELLRDDPIPLRRPESHAGR